MVAARPALLLWPRRTLVAQSVPPSFLRPPRPHLEASEMLSVQELRRMRREELRIEQNAPESMAHDARVRRELLDRVLGKDAVIEGARA